MVCHVAVSGQVTIMDPHHDDVFQELEDRACLVFDKT